MAHCSVTLKDGTTSWFGTSADNASIFASVHGVPYTSHTLPWILIRKDAVLPCGYGRPTTKVREAQELRIQELKAQGICDPEKEPCSRNSLYLLSCGHTFCYLHNVPETDCTVCKTPVSWPHVLRLEYVD